MKSFDYDVIVIWSGSWWLTVSIWLAAAWKKVALVEKWLIGWDCTNTWCVPSKAFIDIAKSGKYSDIKTVLEKTRERRQIIVDEETPEKIEQYWMKVIQGFWKIIWKNTVKIDWKTEITAKNIVLSTGSHWKTYHIEWIKDSEILNNESIFELNENIKDLVVIWGWYIWCELVEAFSNSWVNVTIIQRNARLIPREEKESSHILRKIFEEKWIKVLTDTLVERVEWNTIIVKDKVTKVETKIHFDKVFQALWRWANISNLWLEELKIEHSKWWIKVDKYNRTNVKNIFAIWDCVEWNPMFTHWANNEGRGVIRNILLPYIKSSTRDAILPATLYTNIEVSRVWKTEEELLNHYTSEDIVTKIIRFEKNDRSVLTDDKIWFIKINFRRVSWKILWATIVWSRAWDMLPLLTSAMQNNISGYKLASIVYSYPTKAELIKKVADKFVVWTVSNIKWEIKYFLKDNSLQIITWIIWLIFIFTYFYFKSSYNLTNIDIAKGLYGFISTSFWWPIIYIVLYAIRPVVFFPATFMTFMSWALFWVWGWFLFTMVWENMSANFAYLLGKIFGKKLIKPESTWLIVDLKNKVSENAFISILMTRLLFFPFDAVNYVSWILRVKWRWFFLWTLIWIIPWALVFIIAWASVENASDFDFSTISFNWSMLLMAAWLFVWSLWLAKFLKKKWF